MGEIVRRDMLRGLFAAGLLGGAAVKPAMADDPVKIRLGYGLAAEEQIWLLIAKPELGKNQGELYKLDTTRFQGSDKRAQAFEAGAIDLSEGSATGVMAAAAEGVQSKIICSVTRESRRGFSTSFYVPDASLIKTIPDMKDKIVGINGFETAGHLWLKAALEKNGMTDRTLPLRRYRSLRCRRLCLRARSMSASFRSRSPPCWKSRPKFVRSSMPNTVFLSTKN